MSRGMGTGPSALPFQPGERLQGRAWRSGVEHGPFAAQPSPRGDLWQARERGGPGLQAPPRPVMQCRSETGAARRGHASAVPGRAAASCCRTSGPGRTHRYCD